MRTVDGVCSKEELYLQAEFRERYARKEEQAAVQISTEVEKVPEPADRDMRFWWFAGSYFAIVFLFLACAAYLAVDAWFLGG